MHSFNFIFVFKSFINDCLDLSHVFVNFFSCSSGLLNLIEFLLLFILILGNKFEISLKSVSIEISKDLSFSDSHCVLKMLSLFLVILLVKVSTLSFKSSLCFMEILCSFFSFVNLFLDVSFKFLILVVKFGSLVGYSVNL